MIGGKINFVTEIETEGVMEDLKTEWDAFQEGVANLLKITSDHVERRNMEVSETLEVVQKITNTVKEKVQEVAEKVGSLEDGMSHFEKKQTVSHQVKSLKEFQEMRNEHEHLKVGLVKTQNEVGEILNEQQLTKKLMSTVTEMNCHLESLKNMVNNLQSEISEVKAAQSTPSQKPPTEYQQVSPPDISSPICEWLQRQRKQNNVIIFGLSEQEDESTSLKQQLESLWQDIGVSELSEGEWSSYRVGKKEDGRKRPVIVKFAQMGKKSEILQKARNLKGKAVWNGVAITHDLTKLQCLEERKNELHLRLEAEKRNATLSDSGGQKWRVFGVRGARRIMLMNENARSSSTST